MKAQTPQEAANEQTIRKLYSFANATTKDTRTSSISTPPTTKATCVGHAPGASKVSSEAEATIATVPIATARGRSTAHRRTDNNGHLVLTGSGYSILQTPYRNLSNCLVFRKEVGKLQSPNYGSS
jgi:hypothetical protein